MLVVVTAIVISIAWVSYVALFPVLCGDSAALWSVLTALAVVFEVNILFNYYVAAFTTAGSTKEWPRPLNADAGVSGANGGGNIPATPGFGAGAAAGADGIEGGIPRHAFKDCKLCTICRRAKPPKAHHCRTCRTCVTAMDHHCPFVNNCVGADNMRHFLLFTAWAVAGCAYAVFLAMCVAYLNYGEVKDFFHTLVSPDPEVYERLMSRDPLPPPRGREALWRRLVRAGSAGIVHYGKAFGITMNLAFNASPDWMGGWGYVVLAAGMVVLAVGGLFVSTVLSVAAGDTYIEQLTRKKKAENPRDGSRLEEDLAGAIANQSEGEEGKPRRRVVEEYCPSIIGGAGGGQGKQSNPATRDPESGEATARGEAPSLKKAKAAAACAAASSGGAVKGNTCGSCVNTCERRCPWLLSAFGCCVCCFVPGACGPAPWSKVGMFHLRQVFGSGHPVTWILPRIKPPAGARGAAPYKSD